MQWNEGHTWTLDVQLPVGAVNFKIVMHDQPNSNMRWEMGDDRSVLIPETTTVTGAPVGQVGNTGSTAQHSVDPSFSLLLVNCPKHSVYIQATRGFTGRRVCRTVGSQCAGNTWCMYMDLLSLQWWCTWNSALSGVLLCCQPMQCKALMQHAVGSRCFGYLL